MIGLTHLRHPGHLILLLAALALIGFVAAAAVAASLIAHRPPPPLEWFGVATAALVAAAFMWPPEFFFHFPAFLAPFLALAIALPASRLLTVPCHPDADLGRSLAAAGRRWPGRAEPGVIRRDPGRLGDHPGAPRQPQGRCRRPACDPTRGVRADRPILHHRRQPVLLHRARLPADDRPSETDYALSPGRDGLNGAGKVPALAAIMRNAFDHAQYVWLAGTYNRRRIAWTPALHAYLRRDFVRVLTDHHGDAPTGVRDCTRVIDSRPWSSPRAGSVGLGLSAFPGRGAAGLRGQGRPSGPSRQQGREVKGPARLSRMYWLAGC